MSYLCRVHQDDLLSRVVDGHRVLAVVGTSIVSGGYAGFGIGRLVVVASISTELSVSRRIGLAVSGIGAAATRVPRTCILILVVNTLQPRVGVDHSQKAQRCYQFKHDAAARLRKSEEDLKSVPYISVQLVTAYVI